MNERKQASSSKGAKQNTKRFLVVAFPRPLVFASFVFALLLPPASSRLLRGAWWQQAPHSSRKRTGDRRALSLSFDCVLCCGGGFVSSCSLSCLSLLSSGIRKSSLLLSSCGSAQLAGFLPDLWLISLQLPRCGPPRRLSQHNQISPCSHPIPSVLRVLVLRTPAALSSTVLPSLSPPLSPRQPPFPPPLRC